MAIGTGLGIALGCAHRHVPLFWASLGATWLVCENLGKGVTAVTAVTAVTVCENLGKGLTAVTAVTAVTVCENLWRDVTGVTAVTAVTAVTVCGISGGMRV